MKRTRGNEIRSGFTLIEILVVIGMIAILAGIVLVAINPARQFAQAHNTQRISNVNAILNAIGENIADNRGVFNCPDAGPLPTSSVDMVAASSTNSTSSFYDIAPCLVPTYLSAMPFDPTARGAHYDSNTDYDTGYAVMQDATTSRITVSAPSTELTTTTISVTR